MDTRIINEDTSLGIAAYISGKSGVPMLQLMYLTLLLQADSLDTNVSITTGLGLCSCLKDLFGKIVFYSYV